MAVEPPRAAIARRDGTSACDCNSDGGLDLSDVIYDLSFQFLGGAPPAPPYPACDVFPGCAASCGTQ